MILNVIALLSVLTLAYFWSRYGLLPAMLHLLCTIVAGAIAFGLWEPIAYALLGVAPRSGFFSFLESVVWSTSLLVPFALSLVLLRVVVDKVVPANVRNNALADMIGGGLLGGVAAYIAVGVLVIGAGFLRMPGVLGYQPIQNDPKGSVVRAGGLWIQADSVVASLFGRLSETTLRTRSPLAEVQPDIDVAGYVLQLSHANGKSRNAMRPGDARVLQGYVVGADAGAPMGTLLRYEDGAGAQQVLDLNSQPVGSGRLIGFMLEFQPGAKESFGQVTFTNGQVRMVVEDQRTGETIAVHPHAIISQADPANAEGLRRWPLDTQEVVIASVGGASTVNMGFEFAVPTGYTPKYLYIKNTRLDVSKTELAAYPTRTALTAAVIGGNLGSGSVKVADLERGDAVTTTASAGFGRSSGETGVSITNSIDFGFQTTQKGGLDLDEDNRVVSGTHEFFVKEVESSGNRIDAALRVDRFAVGDGRVMVQVEVSPDKPASMLGRVYRNATGVLPPQIIDNNGTPYQAIGYVYRDSEKIRVSIDPGAPIRGLSQLQSAGVAMSSSRADQRLVLLFLASEGVTITEYALGPKVVLTFDPPLDLSQGQR